MRPYEKSKLKGAERTSRLVTGTPHTLREGLRGLQVGDRDPPHCEGLERTSRLVTGHPTLRVGLRGLHTDRTQIHTGRGRTPLPTGLLLGVGLLVVPPRSVIQSLVINQFTSEFPLGSGCYSTLIPKGTWGRLSCSQLTKVQGEPGRCSGLVSEP